MERQDVDASALAPDVERHFGGDVPPQRSKTAEHPFSEIGMGAVEQSIETLTLPQQAHRHRAAERSRDANEDLHRHTVGSAALDATDRAARYPHCVSKTLLRPAPATT